MEERIPSTTPPLVLAVDDDALTLSILLELLKSLGCRTASAECGPTALDLARSLKPELILLDIVMADLDGFEVCRQLKADPQTREIPVIFLTAMTDTGNIVRGFENGAADYITKPFEHLELAARVKTHLALVRGIQEKNALVSELQQALAQVKLLSGLIPICSKCKKIRNDQGYWQQVEEFVATHSEARFTHGLCPDCIHVCFPDFRNGDRTRESTHRCE